MQRVFPVWQADFKALGCGLRRGAAMWAWLHRAHQVMAQALGIFPANDGDPPRPWPAIVAYLPSLAYTAYLVALAHHTGIRGLADSPLATFLFEVHVAASLVRTAYRAWQRAALCDLMRAVRVYLGQYPTGERGWGLVLTFSAASLAVQSIVHVVIVLCGPSNGSHVGIRLLQKIPIILWAAAETAALSCPVAFLAAMAEDVAREGARLLITSQRKPQRPLVERLREVQEVQEDLDDAKVAAWHRLHERQRRVIGVLQEVHRLGVASIVYLMSFGAVHCTVMVGDAVNLIAWRGEAMDAGELRRLMLDFAVVGEFAYTLLSTSGLYAWTLSKRTELLQHATSLLMTTGLSSDLAQPAAAMTRYCEGREPRFPVLGFYNFSLESVLQLGGMIATYVIVAYQMQLSAYYSSMAATTAAGNNASSFAG